jgi:hypothetical protein
MAHPNTRRPTARDQPRLERGPGAGDPSWSTRAAAAKSPPGRSSRSGPVRGSRCLWAQRLLCVAGAVALGVAEQSVATRAEWRVPRAESAGAALSPRAWTVSLEYRSGGVTRGPQDSASSPARTARPRRPAQSGPQSRAGIPQCGQFIGLIGSHSASGSFCGAIGAKLRARLRGGPPRIRERRLGGAPLRCPAPARAPKRSALMSCRSTSATCARSVDLFADDQHVRRAQSRRSARRQRGGSLELPRLRGHGGGVNVLSGRSVRDLLAHW